MTALKGEQTLVREEFITYEDEILRLEGLTGTHIPSMLGGAGEFLGTIDSWVAEGDNSSLDKTVIVYPDPSSNLSLPYPADELGLAISVARSHFPQDAEIKELAALSGVSAEVLERPTTALSGGERMLVSLAKAFELSTHSDCVCLCSPYFWLDEANRKVIAQRFTNLRGPRTHLLLLAGEESPQSLDSAHPKLNPLKWHLRIDHLAVIFPAQSFPRLTIEKRIHFHSGANDLALQSPTLITGANGVGKTTLAKLLSGLQVPSVGSIRATTGGRTGSARLVLQDTITQLFGQSVHEHLGRVFSFDKELWKEARKTYTSVLKSCLSQVASSHPESVLIDEDRARSVLQCKVAVAVERLLSAPPVLVLDEPGWCLSQPVARAFFNSVVTEAHNRGIAVAIVSHQIEWWQGLIGSEVTLTSTEPSTVLVRVRETLKDSVNQT